MFNKSNNLLIVDECIDSTSLNNTDGSENSNSNYWSTGFINVTDIKQIILSNPLVLRECFYDANKGFLSYSGTVRNPLTIPDNCKYIRLCYSKSIVAFSDRHNLSVYEYGVSNAFEHDKILNNDLYSIKDDQFFYVKKGNYTESFEINMNRGDLGNKNMVVSVKAKYTGSTAPTIQFNLPYSIQSEDVTYLYRSQIYEIGDANFVKEQQFRIPCFPNGQVRFNAVVTIPTGTTLHLVSIDNQYTDNAVHNDIPYRFNAHLGHMYPSNTYDGFMCAAKVGYPCCVAVPKRTSDGVWVCFHDDNNVGNTLRNPDGTALPSTDASKSISDFTYSELLAYDCGIKINLLYAGEKIPTLESFFELCKNTGMHPMLSVHPVPSSSEYAEIKALAKKHQVLKTLNIKGAGINFVSDAYAVFCDEIESYTRDVSVSGIDVTNDTSWFDDLTFNNSRIGVEYFNSVINQTLVTNALNKGLFVACYISYGTYARYKELLEMGVSEITDDNNASYGLNW